MAGRSDRRDVVRALAQGAVLPIAAVAVHQLRFMLAFGGGAGLELQRQGHSYLHSLVPWIVLITGVAVGAFLRRLGGALGGGASVARRRLSFGGLWLTCTVSLVAIFAVQEFLEGLFATGHPAGLAGIFGLGGWWSVPAAACVALVLAALFIGAERVLVAVAARRAPRRRIPVGPAAISGRVGNAVVVPLAPLVGGSSGRGPPS
jgi:hypothetical protein